MVCVQVKKKLLTYEYMAAYNTAFELYTSVAHGSAFTA